MPTHSDDHLKRIIEQSRLTICEQVGDKWFCEDCLKVYNLGGLNIPPLPEKKRSHFEREWTKFMKPQWRLEILERDNFTCQICQRSPLETYGVNLTVAHILPIAEGGKTKPDNLQTFCIDCSNKLKPA